MKISILFSALILLKSVNGFAIGEHIPAGARSSALGGASVAIPDFWSVCNNQAGNVWLKGVSAGLYAENRFLFKEMMAQQIGLVLPCKAGAFGILVNHFGNSNYNELKAGLSYARKFGKRFSMGIQLDYLRIHISEDYGNKNLFSCEIGLMYHSDSHLNIGIQIINPVPIKIITYPPEHLPSIICIGLSYKFSNTLLLTAEAEKDLEHKPVFRAGAEYLFANLVCARIGISTNPVSFSFGFGLDVRRVKIDIASQYQQALGFSPAISIIYSFIKK
jgi:hypothetical protein